MGEKRTNRRREIDPSWDFEGDHDGIVECVKAFMEQEEIEYDYNPKEGIFVSGVMMPDTVGSIVVIVSVNEDSMVCYTMYDKEVPRDRMAPVMEYIMRANAVTNFGNFEVEVDARRVSFKCGFTTIGSNRCYMGQVKDAIMMGVVSFQTFGDGLDAVCEGKETPLGAMEGAKRNWEYYNDDGFM